MNVFRARFDGKILQRGFWIYIWKVTCANKVVYYVGRTGDSSSRFASSPFSRLGQHLDLRDSAKGNALLKNLRKAGLSATEASFEMLAIGPLFPEQETLEEHRKYRDIVSPLESALAEHLKSEGHAVIGTHPSRKQCDRALLEMLIKEAKAFVG